jgi:hypothetical protein
MPGTERAAAGTRLATRKSWGAERFPSILAKRMPCWDAASTEGTPGQSGHGRRYSCLVCTEDGFEPEVVDGGTPGGQADPHSLALPDRSGADGAGPLGLIWSSTTQTTQHPLDNARRSTNA